MGKFAGVIADETCGSHLAVHSRRREPQGMEPSSTDQTISCPRIRVGFPIISRGSNAVQFADDPRLLPITQDEVQWLRTLPHYSTWSTAAESCPGGSRRAHQLLSQARTCGIVEEVGECWWLAAEDRLATSPSLSALSTWHPHPTSAIASRQANAVAITGDSSLAQAAATVLESSGLTRAAQPSQATVTLMVAAITADAPEAAVSLAPASLHDRPHLPIVVFRGRASIGPLVIPGRTACSRCLYLQHRDADPGWPGVLTQWMAAHRSFSIGVDPLLAIHAATVGVTMVRNWMDGCSESLGRRLHIRAPDFPVVESTVEPHPECGCRWSDQAC